MSNSFQFLEKEHSFYTLKEGDTLRKVAKKLELDHLAIRHYHNIYADLKDLIEEDFPRHLKVLILQTEKDRLYTKTKKEAAEKKVSLSKTNFNLVFRPDESKKEFNVRYTIENGDTIDTMRQEMSVVRLLNKKADHFYFEINTVSKLYLNGTVVDGMAVELAENVAQILYPLQIVVDDTGKWIDIYNFDTIQNRWETKKEKLLGYYEGAITDQYIAIVDSTLRSKAQLFRKLSSNWFLRAYFNGIHINYTEKLEVEQHLYYPFSTTIIEPRFLIQQKIQDSLDDSKRLIVEQKGMIDDERALEDFEKGSELPFYALFNENAEQLKGNYEAKYFLDPNKHTVTALTLQCDIETAIPQKINIAVTPRQVHTIETMAKPKIGLID